MLRRHRLSVRLPCLPIPPALCCLSPLSDIPNGACGPRRRRSTPRSPHRRAAVSSTAALVVVHCVCTPCAPAAARASGSARADRDRPAGRYVFNSSAAAAAAAAAAGHHPGLLDRLACGVPRIVYVVEVKWEVGVKKARRLRSGEMTGRILPPPSSCGWNSMEDLTE